MERERRMLIVVGVDGSAAGDYALAWALDIAHRVGGSVEVVTAWTANGPGAPAESLTDNGWAERVQHDSVERALSELTPAPVVAMEVVEGDSGAALVEASRRADLLVLGSHGHRRSYILLLGSTSEYCLRRAHCPVVVIPVPLHDPGAEHEAVVRADRSS
jgi:nucleotide-binding universal stress UspA family protein